VNEPATSKEFGNDAQTSGAVSVWSVACDESMLASNTRCLAIWLAFDGIDPHRCARQLAWEAIGSLKQERPIDFDCVVVDVWAGQRCVEGAFLPQIVLGFVGFGPELGEWLRLRMERNEAFASDASDVDAVELGLFPVARVASGGMKPRSMPIDFLMACSRRYRLAHGLIPWSRDPYAQVATGALYPVEFAWMTADGDIIDAEGGAIEIILNTKLGLADVPDTEASASSIALFAATFDGFEEYGECQAALDTARDVCGRHEQGSNLAGEVTLRELRTALFIEHVPSRPEQQVDIHYRRALVSAVRVVVERERERVQRLQRPSEAPKLGSMERDPSTSGTLSFMAGGPQFEDFDPEEQCLLAHEILLGAGPLEKESAVRTLSSKLREVGHVAYQRLHSDGPLYALLEEIIERCVKEGTIDRPRRGWVRAILSDASAYSRDRWRLCLLSVVTSEPVDRDQAVRAAAEWAREQMGLAFERLREGGTIDKGLRSAMNSAIRRGELVRVGSHSVQKGHVADVASTSTIE